MRRITLIAALIASVFVFGCVPCLRPIYTKENLVFKQSLLGSWIDQDEDNTWIFEKSGENAYRMTIKSDGDTAIFETHLAKIGEHMFLDLYPDRSKLDPDHHLHEAYMMPMHTFLMVDQVEPEPVLSLPDYDKIKKYVEEHPDAIRHERLEGDGPDLLLTGSTKELQAFLLKLAKVPEVFETKVMLTPKPEPKPKPEKESEEVQAGSQG